ncbi:MAG: EAL domain-containing protein [Acidobacteriaceae bacterium]
MAAVLVPALGAAVVCAALWRDSVFTPSTPVTQLASLPAQSQVHLRATVLAADPQGAHIWIHDGTGAIPLTLRNPQPGIHPGEFLLIDALKAAQPAAEPPAPPVKSSLASQAPKKSGRHLRPAPAVAEHLPENQGADGLSLLNAAPGVVLSAGKVVRINRQWRGLALLAVSFLLLWLFVLQRLVASQSKALKRSLQVSNAIQELSTAVQRVTREEAYNSEVALPAVDEVAPLAAGFNAMMAELQRRDGVRRDAEMRLRRMTLMDDITGLPNRRLLSDRLSQCVARARREKKMVALLCVDLDGFKLVNDSYGHANGDVLLAQVGQRLKGRFRHADTLARVGGDEFALVLDTLQSRNDARVIAETVLDLLRPAFEIAGHTVQIGASIGVSIFPDAAETGQLMQQADCAMYAAKRSGRSRIVQFGDDLGTAARERLTLEHELQHAMARGEIQIHYQPEYDLASGAVVRFEALARWIHPELGTILPTVFIPIAEESGLIVPLGAYIMERACAEAVAWQELAHRPVQVAVNVSSVQFARDSFFEEVADVLHRTGLAPTLLQIELTESATVNGMERAAEILLRFKRMGVSVAVDDFGTGYSCLTYLPRLPFDCLKLDRSFVSEMMLRRETRNFVGSILTLARDLQMKVIAEGIETQEQLDMIRKLGTDEAQGYLLGHPSSDPSPHLLLQQPASTQPALA